MKTNIALVGFMGTGKSTVGRLLAEKLGKKFLEMDELIVQKAGRSIPELFHESEIIFREYEMAVCKEVSTLENTVVSAGGGVVLNKLNIDYLKLSSEVILLQASHEEIFKRCIADGKEKRPVINKEDPLAEIRNILLFREPFYGAATEKRVETTGKTVEFIVEEIIAIL